MLVYSLQDLWLHHPFFVARHWPHSCYCPSMAVNIQCTNAQQVLLRVNGLMTVKQTREVWHQTNKVNQLRFWLFPTAAGWHKNYFIWHAWICYSCHLYQAAIWLLPCYVSGWTLNPLPQNFSLRCNVPNFCSSFLVKASFVWCRSHAWILIYLQQIETCECKFVLTDFFKLRPVLFQIH